MIFILSFFVIFFWGTFEQAGASLTFFADEQTDRTLGSTVVPASYFQSANALFIIIFAPIFAVLWTWMGKRRHRAVVAAENGHQPDAAWPWATSSSPSA